MNRMVLQSRVGSDGVLHITVPIGKEDADREVQVTIDPVRVDRPLMTQEEWRDLILTTAGTITDPTFLRHDQVDSCPLGRNGHGFRSQRLADRVDHTCERPHARDE